MNVVVLSCLCNRCHSFTLVWEAYYTVYSLLSTCIHIRLRSIRTQCFSHKVPNHQVGDQGSSFNEKEVPPRENVQRHKGKERVHYLLKEDKGGAKSSNEAHHAPGDQPQKKKTRPQNIKIISDDTRREELIRRERRKRQEKEYKDAFVEDLETAFCCTQQAAQTTLWSRDGTAVNTSQSD